MGAVKPSSVCRQNFSEFALKTFDVLAVPPGRGEFQIAAGAERFVQREDFVVENEHGAAIEQQVVESPDQFIFRLALTNERQTHERRDGEFKAATAICLQKIFETILPLLFRHTAPVELLQVNRSVWMDALLRRRESFPVEARAQNVVPLHDALPRALEGRGVHRLAQRAKELLDVHARFTGGHGVKQHPLLHRRERVRVRCCLCFHLAIPDAFAGP